MSEPFLGQIKMVGFNFAPRGWALCNGQILPINQNQALFSLLGTTYGGDGRSTFALPDLRGRTGVHEGQCSGLRNVSLGQKGGVHQCLAASNASVDVLGPAGSGNVTVVTSVNSSGGERSPYLAVHYVIATQGVFPPRN